MMYGNYFFQRKYTIILFYSITVRFGSKWERESWYIDGRAQEFGFRLSACSREDRYRRLPDLPEKLGEGYGEMCMSNHGSAAVVHQVIT